MINFSLPHHHPLPAERRLDADRVDAVERVGRSQRPEVARLANAAAAQNLTGRGGPRLRVLRAKRAPSVFLVVVFTCSYRG